MKPVKLIHFGDGHYSRENQEPFFKSADFLLDKAETEQPDLITIAGDLFDRAVNDTTGSGFPRLVQWMRDLMNIAPVVAVRGTPTHDPPGCYEVFETIHARYNFILLEPSVEYFLENFGVSTEANEHTSALIFGLPEPSKEWFLKDKQLGKAEGDEEIKQGIRELLLGMGARRKQYPEIPCVLVSHITIAGSSISEAQSLPSGGIQIGKDDLALVGADYYALGHIHLGQQIEDMPAYYCGSMFPVNWGELDQKSFNEVTIQDGSALVHPRFFPHHARKKIVLEKPWNISASEVEGFDVWIQLRTTKEERHTINVDALKEDLNLHAGPGSKVELVTIPTETVRAGQISEAVSLVDKLKVYAELSSETLNDSTIEKAASLEAQAKESGEAGEGLHIRVQKLILRGAYGIKKNTGLDQIEIDLDTYDPGIIALVGPNGSGKTTIIENMHPFPGVFTRPGKLQDHFCLRDSFRDLYFIDERTGTEYRAFMSIDGQNKSGAVEYFLYRHGVGENWDPATEEINGRKDPYVAEITRLFGSIELYLRSAFVSQKQPKNLPDLSDATKGEKKALFRELGGLEYLEVYSKTASETAKALEDKLITIKAKLERVDEIANLITIMEADELETGSKKVSVEKVLRAITEKGESLKAEHDHLKAIVDKNEKLRTEYENVNTQIAQGNGHHIEITESLVEYRSALKGKEATEKLIKEYESLKAEEGKLNEAKAEHERARAGRLARYNEEREIVAERDRELSNKTREAEKAAQAVERERDLILADANNLNKDILENPLSENCPTCGQEWPPEKQAEYESKLKVKTDCLKELQEQAFNFDKAIVEDKKKIETIYKEIRALEWPEEPEAEEYDESKLEKICSRFAAYDIDVLSQKFSQAKEASIRIEEGEKQLKTLEATLNTLNERAADLLNQIDEESETDYTDVGEQLEETRQQYVETDKELTRLNTEIDGLKKQIAEKEAELEDLKALDEERKAKEIDLTEWQYLQRACGPDGVQALELDAMGPGIAEVANSILESAYGARFQIEFRTTRIGGSGSKTKQIEDFQIWIHDSQSGDEQLLETLSGGESVWIKNAIYSAFGIIRARKTGTQFLTVYMDEADGALDPEARTSYFRMLEKAHQEAGRYHTIIITHSIDAQEMIGQRIEMTALKGAVREEVAV